MSLDLFLKDNNCHVSEGYTEQVSELQPPRLIAIGWYTILWTMSLGSCKYAPIKYPTVLFILMGPIKIFIGSVFKN
jgi:hypothetical protein